MANETKMLNVEKIKARFRALPDLVKVAVGTQLAKEVEDLVDAQQRAAPVDELEDHPRAFRDSIHFYPTPDRPLSYRIIADARDPKTGQFIGSHIEAGHKARDGSHVAAKPSFFPTYRARKKGMRRRINAAGRKAIKAAFPSE